jgi:hypothetical protein
MQFTSKLKLWQSVKPTDIRLWFLINVQCLTKLRQDNSVYSSELYWCIYIYIAEFAHTSNIFFYFIHSFLNYRIRDTSIVILIRYIVKGRGYLHSQSQSYVTTDGQSASLSWCQAPIWGPRLDFYYCQTVAGFIMWGALSEERMGLSFITVPGPRQRNHSRIWVTRDSWPYFIISRFEITQPGGPGPRIYIP